MGLGTAALRAVAVTVLLLSALMVVGALAQFDVLREAAAGEDVVRGAVRSIGNGVLVASLAIGAVFGVVVSDRSAMENLLHVAGASRWQRFSVLVAPSGLLAMATALLVAAPPGLMLVGVPTGFAGRAVMAVLLLWLTGVGAIAGLTAQAGLSRLLSRLLRLPQVHANAASAACVLAGAVVLGLPAVRPGATAGGPLRVLSPGESPARAIDGLVDGAPLDVVSAFAVIALFSGVVVVLAAYSATPGGDMAVGSTVPRVVSVPAPRQRSWLVLAWYEFTTLSRSPTTVLASLGAVGLAGIAIALEESLLGSAIVLAPPAVAGTVGLRAVGHNLRSVWLIWLLEGRDRAWVTGKIIGSFGVAVVVFSVGTLPMGALIAVDIVPFSFAQIFAPTFAGAMLAGTLVPVSDEQPLTSAIAGGLTVAVMGGATLGIQRALAVAGIEAELAPSLIFVVLALGSVSAAMRRLQPEAVIAQV